MKTSEQIPINEGRARAVARAAAQELRKSERGRQALVDFQLLLEHGGYRLDSANWKALIDLCQLASRGQCFAVEEQFAATPTHF